MYIYLGIIIILFAFCYGFAIQRKQTFKRLFRIVGYQLYYYVLGGRGVLEDCVYVGRNKTCMYIKTNNSFKQTVFWDMIPCSLDDRYEHLRGTGGIQFFFVIRGQRFSPERF